jgi:signal transduction histidine kinase
MASVPSDEARDAATRIVSLERELAETRERAARDREFLTLALEPAGLLVSRWDLSTGILEGMTYRGSELDEGGGRYRISHQRRLEMIHPDDRQRFERAVRAAIDNGDTAYRAEFRLAPEMGEDRWFEHWGTIARDDTGRARHVLGANFEVTARVRTERELRETHRQLRLVSRRLEADREAERRDLARRLHDDLAQGLTALALHLEMLVHPAPGESLEARREDMRALLEQQLDVVRQLSTELRPPLLDELGLVAALQSFVSTQGTQTGIEVRLLADERAPRASAETESAAYRIVQEAVLNALRHAHPKHIEVSVERRDGGLALRVADDGSGFDFDAAVRRELEGGHIGLLRLRKRADLLDGRVAVDSAPGRGTVLTAWLPLGAPA